MCAPTDSTEQIFVLGAAFPCFQVQRSPLLAARLLFCAVLNNFFQGFKALVKVQLAGIHQHSVFGLAQRGCCTVGILIVARADIGQNILVVVLFAFHQQLFIAALCAGFRGGSQEDFYRCVGQHHSADIAAIHQHIAAGGQSALGIQQKGAHSRNRRHSGSRHADLLGTDGRGDILAVQVKVLGALLQLGIQVDLRQQGLHGSGIMRMAVTQYDLQEAVDTILAGAQKKNKILSDKEKCIVAYHEVGHAMVAALQSHSAPVQKITIVPRTSGALGFTMQVEDGDHTLMTKEEILAKIATMTGGRAAEEVVFNSITTGASNDIEQATKMARAMITRYGMTDDFDMVALETVNNAYLGGDASLACSERTAATVDDKVVEVVKQQHEKAKQMLIENRGKLDEIAKYLYEKETITGEEFMRILTAVPQLPTGAVEQ